jgi:hypothetical protein
MPGENMIYNTGTISINGNTATGTGTNWTAAASQIRVSQTIIVLSNPVQMFQITAINSGTSLTVTPAASPALSGQKYGILVTDSLSVDGLAQSMSQLINEYDENIGAWETFASTSANQTITVTINGTSVTIPAIGGLARKGANSDITELKGLTTALSIAQGGTGAKTAADVRTNLGLGTSNTPFFASLELSDRTPFLDFHHESTTNDYSARLWAPSAATLELKGGSGGGSGILQVEGGYQCRSGTKGTYSASVFNMLWTSGAMRLYVDTSDVGAITVTSSDRELKENIVYQTDREKAAEEVSRWRVALFDMKARGVLEKSVGHLGFIANDMLETSPEVVKGIGLPEGVDLENDDLSGMFYLDPMAAIAKLTLTIQLLQKQIAELQERRV